MNDLFPICVALHQSYETNPVACESRKRPPRPWERFAKRPERRGAAAFNQSQAMNPEKEAKLKFEKSDFFITKKFSELFSREKLLIGQGNYFIYFRFI